MKKLDLVEKEVPLEEKLNFFGDQDSENIVLSWGSPKGAIIESLNQLKSPTIYKKRMSQYLILFIKRFLFQRCICPKKK
ncbi:MAG: hypothetical protein HGA85_06420 [Nanoarchaeota archaeon]|nr:hypothetical protein [Nanoarchaeota archaeon]